MANEIDLWRDLEEAEKRKDKKEVDRIISEMKRFYPDMFGEMRGGD